MVEPLGMMSADGAGGSFFQMLYSNPSQIDDLTAEQLQVLLVLLGAI